MNKNLSLTRKLRKEQTPQERTLWNILRNNQFHNLKFRRQYPIGKHIVDFICLEKRLIIELDGGQHNTPENIEYDKQRTEYLNSRQYKVIRFWNDDISNNLEGVYEILEQYVK